MLTSQADLQWKLEQTLTPIIYNIAPHRMLSKLLTKWSLHPFGEVSEKGLTGECIAPLDTACKS